MRAINRSVLVFVLAAAGCGQPPAVAVLGTPPTAPGTPPTAATPSTVHAMAATPPTTHAMPGLYPKPAPPATTAGDVPPALRDVFVERNQRHQRQAGALLTISAKWAKDPRTEPGIRIDWSIDYDGPRRPFTVLIPDKANGPNPAVAHFWYLKPDGTIEEFPRGLGGGGNGRLPDKKRDDFAVSDGGKPVGGPIEVGGVTSLKGAFGREPRPGDPPLWVQMEYAPTDRGDGFDRVFDPVTGHGRRGPAWTFDTWTGHLWSPVVEVTIK